MDTKILALLAVIACSGCALIPEQVEVNYEPDPSVQRTMVASPATVDLRVSDNRRAEAPAWISDKKNGYGMRMASIFAQRPVADLVKDALTQELTARGVRVSGGSTSVAVEITRLESVSQVRFFSIGAIGSADLSVQVRKADGAIAYARTFSVANDDEAAIAGTPGQARRSVERAMSKVVGQIMSDPAFLGALTTGARVALN